jgi:hypothetical protein
MVTRNSLYSSRFRLKLSPGIALYFFRSDLLPTSLVLLGESAFGN